MPRIPRLLRWFLLGAVALCLIGLLAVGILVCDLMLLSVDEATLGDIAWDVAGVVLAVVGGRAAIQAARGLPGMLASARTAALIDPDGESLTKCLAAIEAGTALPLAAE